MKTAKAFAPGNVSCIFSIVQSKNAEKSGSTGVGFTINRGVIVSLEKIDNQKNIIYFNNKKIKFPTVNDVIKKLTKNKVEISIKSKLPLGCCFGLIGASSLATAYALNKLLNLRKSKKELALVAHTAEVENSTGLGDVVNQYYGGFLVKFLPSYKFKVKKLSIKNKVIYYKIFGKLYTKKIITNHKIKNKINRSCQVALKKIKKIINNKNTRKSKIFGVLEIYDFHEINKKNIFKKIIQISKEFSIKSNLLNNKKIINLIKNVEENGGNASMIMLGNAVFSDKYFKGSKKLIIEDRGVCLL